MLDDVASQTCSRLLTNVAAEMVMGKTVQWMCRYLGVGTNMCDL